MDRAQLCIKHRRDRDSLTIESAKLDLIALSAAVDIDDGTNVASTQQEVRQVDCQGDHAVIGDRGLHGKRF